MALIFTARIQAVRYQILREKPEKDIQAPVPASIEVPEAFPFHCLQLEL